MADHSGPSKHRRSRHGNDPKMIGFWKLGKTIGKGSSGRVKIARHTKTGEYAAVKIVSKQALITSRMSMTGVVEQAEKILLSIEREIVLMKLIDHPNVLRLYDVWETSTELYLILEYVQNGELFDHLVAKGRLSSTEALQYFQQIISAVDYCHRFNVAHRDLKPENLLLDHDNNIKVADFGMAAWEGGAGMLETSCGSPHYASPEVVQGKAYRGYTSDVWSCGVILYALLAGRLPFDDDNIRKLLEKVKLGKYPMPTDIPLAAQHLLSRMLEKNVEKRIKMSEILIHPWFTSLPMKPLPKSIAPPPTLNITHRPVRSTSEIDVDLMANLRTLWHGATDEQITKGLLSEENTWEKAVYYLLLQYRARRLEDYGQEEEEKPPRVPPKDPARSSVRMAKPAPDGVPAAEASKSSDIKENETSAHIRTPAGPRAPPKPAEIASAAVIQSVKPSKSIDASILAQTEAVAKVLPSKESSTELSVPQVVASGFGETMPQFLSQLATHVNTNSPKITQVPPRLATPISFPHCSTSSDDGRFADAEEDDTVATYSVSMTGSVRTATTNASSSGSSSPGDETYGLGISTQIQHQPQMYSGITSHNRSKPTPLSLRQNVNNTPLISPSKLLMSPLGLPHNALTNGGSHMMSNAASRDTSSDKENAQQTNNTFRRPRAGTLAPLPFHPDGKPTIERRRTLGDRHVQIVLPGEAPSTRQKKSISVISSSSEYSSFSASPSASSEKVTWFANLFKFKPASFSLLSVYGSIESRDECRRILMRIGVSVTVENTGNLSCRFEGVTDPAGVMQGIKAVRFRVEFRNVMGTHVVAGFSTSMVMIQEKGALSAFKLLYNRLRREWTFDAPMPILKTSTPGARWNYRKSCEI